MYSVVGYAYFLRFTLKLSNLNMQNEESSSSHSNEQEEKAVLLMVENPINFNIVQKEIGDLRRYQVFLIAIVYLVWIPPALNMDGTVFLEAIPDHWCAFPSEERQCQQLTVFQLKRYFIPFDNETKKFEKCHQYNVTIKPNQATSCQRELSSIQLSDKISCQHGNSYNSSVFNSTVVTEWNLVCSKAILIALANSMFFMGILSGGVVGGYFADRFGRVLAIVVSLICSVGFGVGLSYAPTFLAYVLLRFMLGIFIQISFLVSFVYVMEITGDKRRNLVGINIQNIFVLGECLASLVSFVWRDWRVNQFYISLFPIVILFLFIFVPESPRWLFSRGKYKKGKLISEKMAKLNGNPLSSDVWKRAEESFKGIKISLQDQKSYTALDLFRWPKLRLLTFKLIFIWFVASLVYSGLTLNVATLTGSIFLDNTLNALVEIVGYIFVTFTIDRLGRKKLLFGTFLFGGVCCLVTSFLLALAGYKQDALKAITALSLIGKLAIAAAFAVVYNYTAEVYPTVIRSNGIGLCVLAARIGGVVTPFTLFLQKFYPWTTEMVFGTASILAAITAIFVPETLHKPMLTTIEETEQFLSNL